MHYYTGRGVWGGGGGRGAHTYTPNVTYLSIKHLSLIGATLVGFNTYILHVDRDCVMSITIITCLFFSCTMPRTHIECS